MSEPRSGRIEQLEIAADPSIRLDAKVEHERDVAIFDLLEDNRFELIDGPPGPYAVRIALREHKLAFSIETSEDDCAFELSVRRFGPLIKDYFLICDSYFAAIKGAPPSKIEAIDMARRGVHDDGARQLEEAIAPHARIDGPTARRLFTLLCVLHIRRL